MKLPRAFLLLAFITTAVSALSSKAAPIAFPEVKDLPVQPDMPDVMTMADGTKVTTMKEWRRRREEMKQILEHYELGHAPPPPGNVSGQDIQSRSLLGGAANFRLVHLKFGPKKSLGFDIAIFTPARKGPFPTIINPSFFMTPGVNFTNNAAASADISTNSATTNNRPRFNFSAPVDPERAAIGFSNQLARGYAIVTYRYTQCGEDNAGFRTNSFYPAYPGYDWGVLRGWAWGLSRVVDYVETQRFADKKQLIALGHSRLGKLTMVATAFDDRISLAAPAGSSGAGTGAYRFCGPGRGGKEGIEDMTRKFPYYFVPRLAEFTGQMDKLPFDAHWFIALTAPRPWISIEGTRDQNCVPNAVKQSVLAAQPVYQFLGVSTNRVGVNYEPHRHGLPPEDWNAALDFADQQLRGIEHHRAFAQVPVEEKINYDVYDSFEGPQLGRLWSSDRFEPGAVEFQTSIVHAGVSAAKIVVRSHDKFETGSTNTSGSERAELLEAKKLYSEQNKSYEFSFSMFFPTNFPIEPTRLVIAQWKQLCPDNGACSDDSPVLALRYISGELRITQNLNSPHEIRLATETGESRGRWLDFRFQVRFATNETGRIKAWLGDKRLVDFKGVTANSENSTTGYEYPGRFYFKMGLYRNSVPAPWTSYIDEYRKRELEDNFFDTP